MFAATKWFAGSLLLAALVVSSAGDALALGRCRDCTPPCPPPPPQQIILSVCHPCTGCKYDVPVCIPACVAGAPCVHFERTLIGHGRTVFDWPCGYQVVIRYPHSGGYRVIQRG
ncbi:MAG: hypothetical protein U0793_06440 [Gemmataceae bacterium]